MKLRRSFLRFFLGFLLLSFAPSSMARFVMEKNNLRVTSRDKIEGMYDSAIGNFGIPQYGGSMPRNVVYLKDNQKACKEFDEFGLSFKSKPGALPTILLLDRGRPKVGEFCLSVVEFAQPKEEASCPAILSFHQ